MRSKIAIIFLLLFLLIFYFILDNKLYYYGRSNFHFYHSLPLNIRPVFNYDFGGGFHLEDKHGFWIISKGKHQYVGSELRFTIKEIIKYGYNENELIALVGDDYSNRYIIECMENCSNEVRQEMLIRVWSEKNFVGHTSYKFIDIDEPFFKKIRLARNYLLMTCVVLFLVLFFLIFKAPKAR